MKRHTTCIGCKHLSVLVNDNIYDTATVVLRCKLGLFVHRQYSRKVDLSVLVRECKRRGK